jgi:hypothetical protein
MDGTFWCHLYIACPGLCDSGTIGTSRCRSFSVPPRRLGSTVGRRTILSDVGEFRCWRTPIRRNVHVARRG